MNLPVHKFVYFSNIAFTYLESLYNLKVLCIIMTLNTFEQMRVLYLIW